MLQFSLGLSLFLKHKWEKDQDQAVFRIGGESWKMKHWPIILGTAFVFAAFYFWKMSPDLSWLVKTNLNHQIYMYIGQTTVSGLDLARKISVGLNRRHVLISSFIQLTSIIWVLSRCQALFWSSGDSDADGRHGSCRPRSHGLVVGEAKTTRLSEFPRGWSRAWERAFEFSPHAE